MKLKYFFYKLSKLNPTFFHKINYYYYMRRFKINNNTILIEPQQGRTINGNMFYIIKELSLNKEYQNYDIYLVLKEKAIDEAKEILNYNKIENIKIIKIFSNKYFKLMASAKYLITDTSFLPFFIKKEGQKILNTWHGTPLKCLGKSVKEDYYNIGNVQKNFIIADYLLYPNEYTKEHLINDYMLENICKANIILTGYPRNTAFFDKDSEKEIRKELKLDDKEIIVYMPTWRESYDNNEREKKTIYLAYNILQIEKRLKDNQVLYVNLHPLEQKNINFDIFEKVRKFPEQYETYQFLNIADCLITDYSSVFFDFAITRKKVILFCYDKEEYLKERGLYFDYNDLPFTKVENVDELIKALNNDKQYDESEFINQFCKYDSNDVTKKICSKFILGQNSDLVIENIKDNKKDNILIYTGNLDKNGITSSLRNLLFSIDTNEKNYYLTFSAPKIKKNKEQLLTFPKNVKYISTMGKTNMNLIQKIEITLYRKNLIPQFLINKLVKNVYPYEIKRLYGDINFNTVIQFGGYEYKKNLMFSQFSCNKVIYVHSDMVNEIKLKNNQHWKTLNYAYNHYNKVAIVTEGMRDSVYKISKKNDNIHVAENIINYKSVEEKSRLDLIKFDEKTESTVTLEKLEDVLNSDKKKIITIGRFSPEKGHDRLIKSFNKLYKENKNVELIIIGGAGNQYESTLQLVQQLPSRNNIILIKDMSNPFTILKKCDYFILTSLYEGFGLVVAEADILNKPVISTDIPGIRSFMKKNNGTLVENTEEGIYKGLEMLINNKVKVMNVDYEKYNQNAIKEFYELLD